MTWQDKLAVISIAGYVYWQAIRYALYKFFINVEQVPETTELDDEIAAFIEWTEVDEFYSGQLNAHLAVCDLCKPNKVFCDYGWQFYEDWAIAKEIETC